MFGTYGEEVVPPRHFNLRFYFRQQPVMLAVFSIFLVIFFLFVTGLSRVYYSQRQALGTRWSQRGTTDLKAQNYSAAVTDFRTALLYSRDDYSYQLNLAEALIGTKRRGQAAAYLLNLWDREPEDGLVNLELARISVQQGQMNDAIRYYHDAVYAAWPSGQENKRRDARLELIELLLGINSYGQAQSELIALSENVGNDPVEQAHLGDLFVRANDYEHALTSYRLALKYDRHNLQALLGAGNAAYQLELYILAERYLQAAVAANPQDTQSADRLKTTELVLKLDPFRREISAEERSRIVIDAFTIAGDRLKHCAIPGSAPTTTATSPASVSDSWAALKPKMTAERLRRDPDLVDSAMDLVFHIERQTSILCGTPTGADLALQLIAKLHEGA